MAQVISGSMALAVASKNPSRQWVGGTAGTTAKERFDAETFMSIAHTPKFKLTKQDRIFTMGSCFAREVESNLIRAGVPLVTKDFGILAEYFESWDADKGTGGGVQQGQLSRGAMNKYTVASMSHEIRRVLLEEAHTDDGLIELQPGVWFDPHAAGLSNGTFEAVQSCRYDMAAATNQIRTANVVFLTLGLVEGWVDTVTGLAMNRAPGGRNLVRLADRFNFVVPDYVETLKELEQTISLFREVCNSEMRFIITVSPVPFHATFRAMDVITANAYSKALLRTVCDEITRKYDYVDYFPSYETVVNSPRHRAWVDDHLHVHPTMVRHVMDRFMGHYSFE